nr:uncharacterized protein LOC117601073 [Osmia lignaria]
MSATIRPVLVLSLLMLSLSAEAEEMMDPFVLIRQTLKYWLKIYKIYHEEVALGYCWAEYFLLFEKNMKNVSRSVSQESSNSEFASPTLLSLRKNDVPRDEFKESRTEDYWMLGGSMGSSRKFLSPKMGQGSSGASRKVPFLFQFFHPDRVESFDGSLLSVGETVDSDPRFEDDAIKELEGNKDKGDFPRERKLNSVNLKLQRVEQRLSSFEENQRGNLRGKRDVNDQIRGFVWLPLRIRRLASSRASSSDEISKQVVWKTGIESRSSNSRNLIETLDKKYRLRNNKAAIFATNIRPMNTRSKIKASFVIPGGIVNVPGQFITINPRALPRNRSPDEEKKQGSNCGDENSSKQLPNVSDNRYRRSQQDFLVVESNVGRNATIPVGTPFLPPINYPQFMGDDSWPRGTSTNSRSTRSFWAKDRGRRPPDNRAVPRGIAKTFGTFFRIRETFMGFLRTLGFFVQVGRELIDYVESNTALACTKDYLWGKAVQWIDS